MKKLIVLIFCFITIIPLICLLITSALAVSVGDDFNRTVLGNLLKNDE